MAASTRPATTGPVLSRYRPRWQHERAETRVICSIRAPLAPCTGLALLRSLRTHSDAAAIALSPTLWHARSFLSCLGSLSFVLWPALFLLLFCGTPRHASSRARFPRHVSPHQHARARCARTEDAQRRTIRHTTCGPPEWLAGKLQDEGTRSVRSPPRRAPLFATPIATPLQGGRPERPGLLFLKLLRRRVFRVFRVRELAGRGGSASEAPPLNPHSGSKEVGVAHRHCSRQQGKRYKPRNEAGRLAVISFN